MKKGGNMAEVGPEPAPSERRAIILEGVEQEAARPEREERPMARLVAGGSLTEAIAGLAAAALAIIALAGALPGYLAAIAAIAVSVALLAQGSAAAARWARLVSETSSNGELDPRGEIGSAISGEILGGAAGLVLGILALVGVAPYVLIPVTLLAFGGALLVGTGASVDLVTSRGVSGASRFERGARDLTVASSGTRMLIGIATIILGILALIGIDPLTLSLVGLLAVGASIFFSGSAVSSRVLGLLRR
jgi:hypothetical protein